jgi:hypothetical protein
MGAKSYLDPIDDPGGMVATSEEAYPTFNYQVAGAAGTGADLDLFEAAFPEALQAADR